MNYFLYRFTCEPVQPTAEILVTLLAELEFESFVSTENGVEAYVPANADSETEVKNLLIKMEGEIDYHREEIQDQNWNAQWEADYEPVCVKDKFRVRAPFHKVDPAFEHDILIQPQMSFGTGHHETTWLMLDELHDLNLSGKAVLDAGSGTGVLAIAARRLGAERILAYDIEDWAYENTLENIALNNVEIEVLKGDVSVIGESTFGVILANINKNVLKNDMSAFAQALLSEGHLVLSGFFKTDVEELTTAAGNYGLEIAAVKSKNDWALLNLRKHSL
ncbi:MAG: 50S ribosomal protein L11 methyltransferase [Bacteroidota bacterium]